MRHTFSGVAGALLLLLGVPTMASATTELTLSTGGMSLTIGDNSPGVVYALSLTNAGSGYTSAPTVKITGGGGTGATAKAVINTSTHKITQLVLLTPGTGYTSNPTVTITGGGGTGGKATAAADYDANGENGVVEFIGALKNWTLNVTTGIAGLVPAMDLNSVDICGSVCTGANALTIQFSSTGFHGPVGPFESEIGGTAQKGMTLKYQSYEADNNQLFAKQNVIVPSTTFTTSAFSYDWTGGAAHSHTYSLTQIVTISATGKGTASFDATTDATVPEPSATLLLGTILLATVAMHRCLRRKAARQ